MTLLQEQSSDVQQIDRLLDILIDSKEPFRERQLGGGPWQVSHLVSHPRTPSLPCRCTALVLCCKWTQVNCIERH